MHVWSTKNYFLNTSYFTIHVYNLHVKVNRKLLTTTICRAVKNKYTL